MADYVSNNWLVDVTVNVNTAVSQVPSFQECLIVCVAQSAYVPTVFGTSLVKKYSSYVALSADFTPQETAAIVAGDTLQANRLHQFLETAYNYFAQSPTPGSVYVGIAPYTATVPVDYATSLTNIAQENNVWYAFVIADQILPQAFSYCVLDITCTGATTITKGTTATPDVPGSTFKTLETYALSAASYPFTFQVPFYSTNATAGITAASFTGLTPAYATVSSVTNLAASVDNCPGIITGTGNVASGLVSLRTLYGPKKCLADTDNVEYAGDVQALAGNKDLLINYYVYNCQAHYSALSYSLSGAGMGRYFVDLFDTGVGLKTYALMQLSGLPADPTVTTTNIGNVTQPGGTDNLIGWNNNVYAGLGIPCMQYGTMSNSIPDSLVYLDQIVGADYLQLLIQNALVTLLLNSQATGGLSYDNTGIGRVVSTIEAAAGQAAALGIIQQPKGGEIVYKTVQQISAADITARLFKDIVCNYTLVSRIQQIKLVVNVSLEGLA